MGLSSIGHWLVVLLIVIVVFGTKKLRNIGSDLGGAIKGFKDGMKSGDAEAAAAPLTQSEVKKDTSAIDVETKQKS